MKIKKLSMRGKEEYKPTKIESYWQKCWRENKIYSPNLDSPKKPFYNLMMFPYPSASGMHVGNMYAFTGADVYGRFQRMQGSDVFEPIGLDGFGIHSENYAIKIGEHPKDQAKISEKNFYRQLHATGNGFDWTRTVETYKPEYYKWTQWLFIQLFKAGLAYRKKAPVNFCPSCKTVLADEQVIQKLKTQMSKLKTTAQNSKVEEHVGVCERCETPVEKKELEQWFFRITKYADRLLANIDKLDWTEKVKIAQRQWIGRSEGSRINFKIVLDSPSADGSLEQYSSSEVEKYIEVFTTRPDTLYGATFIVVSPEHPVVAEILKGSSLAGSRLAKLKAYIEEVGKKSEHEKMDGGREKTGVFTGLYGINPVNNEQIPIWIADYAVMEFGTGALFGDAHDERDFAFAKKYGIPLKPTIVTGDKKQDKRIMSLEECFTGYGTLVNSGEFSGLTSQDAIKKVLETLVKKGSGRREITYHLRDWLISRQRYWGSPIPMIYCETCAKRGSSWSALTKKSSAKEDYLVNLKADSLNGWPDTLEGNISKHNKNVNDWNSDGWFPVIEKDLPVLLPDVKDWKPKGSGKSPLANVESFVNTKCPNCGSPAKRETDVSDNFLDSAWYFFRYLSTDIDSSALDIERAKKWLPVKMYIGGAEHSVLHLLYSRFITMALHDLGFIAFEEPFARFYAHGLLIKQGAKMSKSRGNVVVPDAYIRKYGADTLRIYLMFLGPFNMGGDFYDTGIEGVHRFVKRVWSLVSSIKYQVLSIDDGKENINLDRVMHKTIQKVTKDIAALRYNTAIAHIMEYYNSLHKFYTKYKLLNTKYCKTLVLLLAPFAPHMTEELYQFFRTQNSIRQLTDKTQNFKSIHLEPWPKYDPKFLEEDEVTIVVQVNGKLRETIKINPSTCSGEKLKMKNDIEQLARNSERVKRHLEGKAIKKVVYVEGKVINFVVE